MNKLMLKELRINGRNIKFKSGVNYIVGMNGSGKTTLFYAIQYLLGLRIELNHYGHFFGNEYAYLETSIGGVDYLFSRSINSKNTEVHSRGFKYIFYTNSSKYDDFLTEIFQPKYNSPTNGKEIKGLIKQSFISEELSIGNKLASRFEKDSYSLLLGVNTLYATQIKQYISQLQAEIERKKITNQEIATYKDNVGLLARRELGSNNIVKIEEILDDAYANHLSSYNEALELYEKSKILLDDINLENEKSLGDSIDRLNSKFMQSLALLSIPETISIYDVINSKLDGFSYGKKTLLNLVTRLIIQADFVNNNSIGLIVNDSILGRQPEDNLRDLIRNMYTGRQSQYIEFTFATDIERQDVVYELGRGGRYV